MMREGYCKESIMTGFHSHQCSRRDWKDGYCKQHHPDSVRARQEKSMRKYEEKVKNSPWNQLKETRALLTEALEAARAFQELTICYRIGKTPSEALFTRLAKARAIIAKANKE